MFPEELPVTFMSQYRSPWMNDELELLSQTARRFFAEHVVPRDAEFRANHMIDPAVWRTAGQMGLVGMSIPEELGGHGGTGQRTRPDPDPLVVETALANH